MISVSRNKILKEFKNALFNICLKDSGVLTIDVQAEKIYDPEDIKQIIKNTKRFADGKKYLILVKTGPLTNTTFEALRLLAAPEASEYAHSKAYVLTSISQRLMANFFVQYFKPKLPIKFFKEARSAEAWLLKNYRHLLR